MKETLKTYHKKAFSSHPTSFFFSPATIRLLGEGADVFKGNVLTGCLNKGLYAGISAREDLVISVQINFYVSETSFEIDLSNIERPQESLYARLIIALIKKLQYEGYKVAKGLNISIISSKSLPKNLGLHATFEVLIAKIFSQQNAFNLKKDKMVKYTYLAEKANGELNTYIGGHHTAVYGKANHLLSLDTRTMSYEHIPFDKDNYCLLSVFISRPKFILNADITERIQAIKKATQAIRPVRTIDALSELSIQDFMKLKKYIKNSQQLKYVEHVMFEMDRVKQGVDYLKNHDYVMFGDIMEQSQNSLRQLYEISNQYHNDIIRIMYDNEALGSRLSNIGYDQIVISVFEKENMPTTLDAFQDDFYNQYKKTLEIQKLKLSDGVSTL